MCFKDVLHNLLCLVARFEIVCVIAFFCLKLLHSNAGSLLFDLAAAAAAAAAHAGQNYHEQDHEDEG